MEEVEIIALLVKLRKDKGLNQKDMAVALDISLTQYSKYENLRSKLNLETFIKILDILGLNTNEFFSINSNITKDEIQDINEKLSQVLQVINSKS